MLKPVRTAAHWVGRHAFPAIAASVVAVGRRRRRHRVRGRQPAQHRRTGVVELREPPAHDTQQPAPSRRPGPRRPREARSCCSGCSSLVAAQTGQSVASVRSQLAGRQVDRRHRRRQGPRRRERDPRAAEQARRQQRRQRRQDHRRAGGGRPGDGQDQGRGADGRARDAAARRMRRSSSSSCRTARAHHAVRGTRPRLRRRDRRRAPVAAGSRRLRRTLRRCPSPTRAPSR